MEPFYASILPKHSFSIRLDSKAQNQDLALIRAALYCALPDPKRSHFYQMIHFTNEELGQILDCSNYYEEVRPYFACSIRRLQGDIYCKCEDGDLSGTPIVSLYGINKTGCYIKPNAALYHEIQNWLDTKGTDLFSRYAENIRCFEEAGFWDWNEFEYYRKTGELPCGVREEEDDE